MYKKMITVFCVVNSFLMVASVQQGKGFIKDKPLEYREYVSVVTEGRKYTLLNVETADNFVIVATKNNEGDSVITTEKEFLRVLNSDTDKKLFIVNHALSKGYTELDLFASDIDIDKYNRILSIEQPVVLDFICVPQGGLALKSICLLQEEHCEEGMNNYNSLSAQVSQETSFEDV